VQENILVEKSLRQEEEQLREQTSLLNSEQKKRYYALEVTQVKDPDTYAALNWAFLPDYIISLKGNGNVVCLISC